MHRNTAGVRLTRNATVNVAKCFAVWLTQNYCISTAQTTLEGERGSRQHAVMASERETLDRFISAQADVIADALAELRAGQKSSHWMWFVFPQLRGLGMSPTAQFYGISDLAEAQAYLTHPLLGRRLIECTEAVLAVEGRTLHQIFGSPDDMKFRSSMTLFAVASAEKQNGFRVALDRVAGGQLDSRTLGLLSA